MKEPGLDGRHRDEDGEISRKRSDTLIGTLRNTYPNFAPGFPDSATLGEVKEKLGADSLSQLLKHPPK